MEEKKEIKQEPIAATATDAAQKTPKKKTVVWWKHPTFWLSIIFLGLILIDQLIKIWADHYFIDVLQDPYGEIVIIPNVIEICIAYNRGIAFGSFSASSMGWKIVIVVGTALLMAALAVLFFKMDSRRALFRLALVFIIAGGVGNLIDRVIYRVWDPATATGVRDGVRDMVRLTLIFDFGVCNFADFFIVAGAIMLLLALLFFDGEALFPMTKKYKALAKEYKEKEEAKKIAKAVQIAKEAREAAQEAQPVPPIVEEKEEKTEESTDEESHG